MEIARAAWGVIPDWIEALIAACDAEGASQSKVAKRLGRSPSVISQAMRREYSGDMADLEERVRSVICVHQVKCPALDWISSADCWAWRQKAKELHSPIHVRMFRQCRKCPRYKKEPHDAGEA